MRLNKQNQYSILLCLYLSRAGRARLQDVSENLGIPVSFLEQIARKLRLGGVLLSTKGPGGGYQLNEDTTMLKILEVMDNTTFLTQNEQLSYKQGQPEDRAFEKYVSMLSLAVSPVLRRRVKAVMQELIVNEVAHLDKLDTKGLEN